MDSTFFLFFETLAFLIFFYSQTKEDYQVLFIFLSLALFLPLSLASYNVEHTYALVVGSEIQKYTISSYDEFLSYLNLGMFLLSLVIGVIKTYTLKEFFNKEEGA